MKNISYIITGLIFGFFILLGSGLITGEMDIIPLILIGVLFVVVLKLLELIQGLHNKIDKLTSELSAKEITKNKLWKPKLRIKDNFLMSSNQVRLFYYLKYFEHFKVATNVKVTTPYKKGFLSKTINI